MSQKTIQNRCYFWRSLFWAAGINSEMWIKVGKGILKCAAWLRLLGWDHRRAKETPNAPDQLCIHGDRSVIIRSFTWSLHGPLLLACQKASAGLDGREQS